MEKITDFFASPRKVKEISSLEKEKQEKKPEVTIKEKQSELKSELKQGSQTIPVIRQELKQRYKAIPKERKVYFEKRSDLFSMKRVQVNDSDYRFLSDLEKSISIARRHITLKDRANYRITSNTIIRLALENFVEKASVKLDDEIHMKLQSEDAIREWIKSL